MHTSKSQFNRWNFLHSKFRTGKAFTAPALAEEFEVSVKTIRRDIIYLTEMLGFPIVFDRRRNGFCYSEENYALDALFFRESEMLSLLLMDKVLKPYAGTPFYAHIQKALEKVKDMLGNPVLVQKQLSSAGYSFAPARESLFDQKIFDTLMAALEERQRVEISYQKPHEEQSRSRIIAPYHVYFVDGRAYVHAFCYQKQDLRTFALPRIKSIRQLPLSFELPPDYDPESVLGRLKPALLEEETEVEIIFDAYEEPYLFEQTHFPGQSLIKLQDGSLCLTFKTRSLFEVRQWVLSFGGNARVLKPSVLKEEIRREVAKLAEIYLEENKDD